MAAGVDEEPAAASVFAASTMLFSAFSLPALAGCGAASVWAVPVDMAVAEGSAVPGATAESVDGAAPAFAAAGALRSADFGVAGFVAATVVANVTSAATVVASDCVAGRFTDAAAVSLAAV